MRGPGENGKGALFKYVSNGICEITETWGEMSLTGGELLGLRQSSHATRLGIYMGTVA